MYICFHDNRFGFSVNKEIGKKYLKMFLTNQSQCFLRVEKLIHGQCLDLTVSF